MLVRNISELGNGNLDKFEAIFLHTGRPGNNGILDEFRCNVHPIDADVIAVVWIMDKIVVQRNDLWPV